MRTWEQIGKSARRKVRRRTARFESQCVDCRCVLRVGDPIVQPYVPSRYGGNREIGWYCPDCAEFIQRGVDCGYLAVTAPWLTAADQVAFEARPDVQAWLAEHKRRKAAKEEKAVRP